MDIWARIQDVECWLKRILDGTYIPKPAGCVPGQILYIKPDGCVGCRNAGDNPDPDPDPDPTTFIAKWGWSDSGLIPTEGEINAFPGSGTFNTGADITANFSGSGTPQFLFLVEPATEPIKLRWKQSDLNQGSINSEGLFRVLGTVAGKRVYATWYETELPSVQFFKTA